MQLKHTLKNGFTLIEMMITLAVIAVVLSVVVPSFTDFFDKNRLKHATEEVYGLMARAKADTVTRDSDIIVTINADAWCVGYATTAGCNCTLTDPDAAGACAVPVGNPATNVLTAIDGTNFTDVVLAENLGGATTFNRIRGTAGNGTINMTAGDWALDIIVSTRGRIRICGPQADTTGTMGYSDCGP